MYKCHALTCILMMNCQELKHDLSLHSEYYTLKCRGFIHYYVYTCRNVIVCVLVCVYAGGMRMHFSVKDEWFQLY